jgi:hypothetical protein
MPAGNRTGSKDHNGFVLQGVAPQHLTDFVNLLKVSNGHNPSDMVVQPPEPEAEIFVAQREKICHLVCLINRGDIFPKQKPGHTPGIGLSSIYRMLRVAVCS